MHIFGYIFFPLQFILVRTKIQVRWVLLLTSSFFFCNLFSVSVNPTHFLMKKETLSNPAPSLNPAAQCLDVLLLLRTPHYRFLTLLLLSIRQPNAWMSFHTHNSPVIAFCPRSFFQSGSPMPGCPFIPAIPPSLHKYLILF